MEQSIIMQDMTLKRDYEKPEINIVEIFSVDIMAMSGGDSNQGEWDEQVLNEN